MYMKKLQSRQLTILNVAETDNSFYNSLLCKTTTWFKTFNISSLAMGQNEFAYIIQTDFGSVLHYENCMNIN